MKGAALLAPVLLLACSGAASAGAALVEGAAGVRPIAWGGAEVNGMSLDASSVLLSWTEAAGIVVDLRVDLEARPPDAETTGAEDRAAATSAGWTPEPPVSIPQEGRAVPLVEPPLVAMAAAFAARATSAHDPRGGRARRQNRRVT